MAARGRETEIVKAELPSFVPSLLRRARRGDPYRRRPRERRRRSFQTAVGKLRLISHSPAGGQEGNGPRLCVLPVANPSGQCIKQGKNWDYIVI